MPGAKKKPVPGKEPIEEQVLFVRVFDEDRFGDEVRNEIYVKYRSEAQRKLVRAQVRNACKTLGLNATVTRIPFRYAKDMQELIHWLGKTL